MCKVLKFENIKIPCQSITPSEVDLSACVVVLKRLLASAQAAQWIFMDFCTFSVAEK